MNVQEATMLVIAAERAADEPVRYWCGIDTRNGKIPMCIGEGEDLQELIATFNLVADGPDALVDWLVETDAVTRMRVLLEEYDRAEDVGNITETLRSADRVIAEARRWATETDVRLEAPEGPSGVEGLLGNPTQGGDQEDTTAGRSGAQE